MVLGLGVARFGDSGESSRRTLVAGGILLATGALGVVYGSLRYRSAARSLRDGMAHVGGSTLGPVVAAFVLLLAMVPTVLVILT